MPKVKQKPIEEVLDDALGQIERKKYDTELVNRGFKKIIHIAIVFHGKKLYFKEKFREI